MGPAQSFSGVKTGTGFVRITVMLKVLRKRLAEISPGRHAPDAEHTPP